MKHLFIGLAALLCFGLLSGAEAEKKKVAIFDFTTIDLQGQKFYEYFDREVITPPIDSLTEADRAVIDDRFLGMVKMMEVADQQAEREHKRERLDNENDRNRARREELAARILSTPVRSVVIGADYMAAALADSPRFEVIDRGEITRALLKIEAGRSVPAGAEALNEFASASGADYILYGTVADFEVRERKSKVYDTEIQSTTWSLDVLVKLVEAKTRRVVFSGVFTGTEREMQTQFAAVKDSGRFKKLMTSAVNQAAAALNQVEK